PNRTITGGLAQGSSNITLNSVSDLAVGQIVQINQVNDTSMPVVHVSGFQGMQRQKSRITAINGNNVAIWPPLYWTLKSSLNPVLNRAAYRSDFVGVEDLVIKASGSTAPQAVVGFNQSYGCWLKGVRVE